jgi:hypothetical protein
MARNPVGWHFFWQLCLNSGWPAIPVVARPSRVWPAIPDCEAIPLASRGALALAKGISNQRLMRCS